MSYRADKQDANSTVNALELHLSCTNPSICCLMLFRYCQTKLFNEIVIHQAIRKKTFAQSNDTSAANLYDTRMPDIWLIWLMEWAPRNDYPYS